MLSRSATAARRLLLRPLASAAGLSSYSSASTAAVAVRSPVLGCAAKSNAGCKPAITWLTRRFISSSLSHLPQIADPDVEAAFKDLLATNWDELPESVVEQAKKALAKSTEDKAGQEALKNLFSAAEASVEFGGQLVSLRMALDDLSGMSGEKVGPLPGYVEDAVKSAYNRYAAYLDSFGPDEVHLRKKIETELGTKMIHLKMRCSGIGKDWGKITLVGTSGIYGSFVELRA